MTTMYFLSLTPIGLAATVIAASSENLQPPYLQYGALGLCAFLVACLVKYLFHQSDLLTKQNEKLADLTKNNTEAYNRLANMLEDRPCLKKDSRIQGG